MTLSLAAGVLGACADETTAPPASDDSTSVVTADGKAPTAEKADRWSDRDDPSIFSSDLEYRVTELPRDGEVATVPWASSYWPVYQDSINFRWDGADSESPAAKYGRAFGINNLEEIVSRTHGVDKYTTRTACTKNSDCDSDKAEKCAKRHGETDGYCIPTWWGICHAWAPASIIEAEPVHPVEMNGVTFKVNDIKALVTLVYNRSKSRFVSLRCNETDSLDEIEYDEYGRPTGSDIECKDTNPGTYHLLLTNYLGLKGQSFVEDRTFDSEVWNQPLRSYRITKMQQVDAQKANQLVGVTAQAGGDAQVHDFSGTVAEGQWHHADAFEVSAGKTLTVVMTGTADADLYVNFGSRPDSSTYACRPYASGSDERCEVTVPAGATRAFVAIHGYSGPADFDVTATVGASDSAGIPTTYLFNDDAVSFYEVNLEVDYIAESASETDGNLAATIDRYTHTDFYSYVLEVDGQGKIIGGEWTGDSKKDHPDFLWLPTGRYEYGVAEGKITYAKVKELLDRSVGGGGNSGGEMTQVKESGSVGRGDWKHFGPFEARGDFSVVMTGTGDADLYLRKGAQPTSGSYDCRPYSGGSNETCTGAGAGTYYVSVNGYSPADFELDINYRTDEGSGDPNDPPQLTHLNESGSVGQNEMLYFSMPVVQGRAVVVRTTAPSDIDLYVKMNIAPTTAVYDQRGYTASGDETLTVVPAADGILHIGVHGYAASSFTLRTADQ